MKTIKVKLSHSSIQDCIRQLEEYKKSLPSKTQRICVELAALGINVARMNTGAFGSYIQFSMDVSSSIPGVQMASVIMSDASPIISQWRIGDGEDDIRTAEISPSLFEEFGSGKWNYRGSASAEKGKLFLPTSVDKREYGRGSFPDQTHAFDESWWYKDLQGEWHQSSGYRPNAPLYMAYLEISRNAERVIREVFNNG